MVNRVVPLLAVALLAAVAPAPTPPPAAAIQPVTDDYFGTTIIDPYRWMENAQSPALAQWMKAQNDYTRAVLDAIPGRATLLAQLDAVSEGIDVEGLQVAGRRRFFELSKNGGTEKLYYREGNVNRLLFDPQQDAPRGAHAAIEYFAPSIDGRFVAIGVAINGAERQTTIRVIETTSGRDLGEWLTRAWGATPYWVGNTGFFYSRLPASPPGANPRDAEQRQQVFFHHLGRSDDSAKPNFGFNVLHEIAPTDQSAVYATPRSALAVGIVTNGADNVARFYAAPLSAAIAGTAAWRPLGTAFLDPLGGSVDEPGLVNVALHGDVLYATRFDSLRRTEVVAANVRRGETLDTARVVIAPSNAVHRSLTAAADGLYVWSASGGLSHIERVSYGSRVVRHIALPYEGTLTEPAGNPTLPGVAFGITAWTRPLRFFAYDPHSQRVTAIGVSATTNIRAGSFSADEVTATSKDGTRVPISIIRANNVALDGSHPAILLGYGAYGESIDPQFDGSDVPWLRRGGIVVIAHVRGGGEFGEPWHLAGKGAQKQHSVDDFIACAEYLIAKGYTSTGKLAGWGGSAGGVVIGNAIVQRPDLFAVAIDRAGFTDMLRYETTPNGPPNVPEFGSVSTEQGFRTLYATSPYNHVVDGTRYPATLLATGANDPRVAPWMVAKMAARLQAASTSGKPVLLRVDYTGGHGIDSTLAQFNELQADAWAFILWQTGDPAFQPR